MLIQAKKSLEQPIQHIDNLTCQVEPVADQPLQASHLLASDWLIRTRGVSYQFRLRVAKSSRDHHLSRPYKD